MTPLAEAGMLLSHKTHAADRCADIRDGRLQPTGEEHARLYNTLTARAQSIARHGPKYLMDAAREWIGVGVDARRAACSELIAAALAAGA